MPTIPDIRTGTLTLPANKDWLPFNQCDVYLECLTSTGAIIINLPEISGWDTKKNIRFYVSDQTGNAAANNITINAPAGCFINGVSSVTLNTNFGQAFIVITNMTNYLYFVGNGGGGPSPPPGTQSIALSATTTSAAAVQLLRVDNGLPLAPPAGKTWIVKLFLASRRSVGATVNESTGWEYTFTYKGQVGPPTVVMVGTSSVVFQQLDASTGTIAFDQGTLDGSGVLQVTGEAAMTDLWAGTAYVTEI